MLRFVVESKLKKYEKFTGYRFNSYNIYGASVICNPYSFGGDKGLWEIAVLDKNGHITYKTPITDDVIGLLNDDEVIEVLNKIKELEK